VLVVAPAAFSSLLWRVVGGVDGAQRIAAFSHGFYALDAKDGRLHITDLRMGQEPSYSFSFAVAARHSPPAALVPAQSMGRRADPDRALPWLWRRLQGEPLPPPR
jgi:inner membrane protein